MQHRNPILALTSFLFLSTVLLAPVSVRASSKNLVLTEIRPDTTVVEIPEIKIGENRMNRILSRQNRNIRVLDRQLLDALPARSLNEVLGHLSGVDIRQRGPFGSQADVSIDGGTFEQTLILVDGIKMLDAQTAHHSLNLPVPIDMIERIEIIRGPAARVYGINSLTGAINIITRKPSSTTVVLSAHAGTNFKKDTSSSSSTPFHSREVQFAGNLALKQMGNHSFALQHSSGNGHRYNTGFHQNKLYYQGNIPQNEQANFTIIGGYISNEFGANGFYAAPGDKESQEIVETAVAAVSYQATLSPTVRINPKISFRSTTDDYRYFRYDLTRARSEHYGYTFSPEIHATWQNALGQLGFGAEWRREQINSNNIGQHDRSNYGAYAEFDTHLRSWLSINAGAYLNYNTVYGWQWFPGIDLGLQLNDQWKWTMHSGTGQRIPSFTDLYLNQHPGNIGNASVLPEESWQIETGLKYHGQKIQGQTHYFYRTINNFIDWVHPLSETPPYQPLNFNNNRTHGYSTSWDLWLTKSSSTVNWRVNAQYTYLHPTTLSSLTDRFVSKYSIESLRQQLAGQVHFRSNKFSALLAGRYQERISYKDYFLADLRAAYQFNQIEIYFDVQNILDISYIEAAAIPMPGRWMTTGIKFVL